MSPFSFVLRGSSGQWLMDFFSWIILRYFDRSLWMDIRYVKVLNLYWAGACFLWTFHSYSKYMYAELALSAIES